MYRDHSVGVVMPAFNEVEHVGNVLRAMPAFVDRIYAVDDGSTDGTAEEIRRVATEVSGEGRANEYPPQGDRSVLAERIRDEERIGLTSLLHHRRNFGPGGAIKTGYLAALRDDVDLVATIDGDGQMEPELLSRFLDPIVDGDADYVKGDRLHGSDPCREMSRFRLLGNVVLTLLTRLASGYWGVWDSQNGYTAISREALSRVEVESLYEYYGYLNDLLTRLGVNRMQVVDVPHPSRYDTETSHIDYVEYIPRVAWRLLSNFQWRLRAESMDRATAPFAVAYGCGVAFGVVGVLSAAYALVVGAPVGTGSGWIATVGGWFAASVALFCVAVSLDVTRSRTGRGSETTLDVQEENPDESTL